MTTLKQKLKMMCLQRLNDKIDAFQSIVEELSLGAQNDAKSSAGDKHETALSMMHLEQENLSKKIQECFDLKDVVSKIDENKQSEKVEFGSVVKVNTVHLFFSAALPKIVVEEISVLPISVDAPIAKELLGRRLKDTFVFNNCEFTIHHLE
ncbi:hypothetical protein [Myroides indicus]|uniref:GreA/GreB family transcription elongation factor n=1 Tax=Myroides indicus TaxID=1323422 RepID=A0A4R7FF70_9FLAO|nr:hypothetical protein [Myroides indicus]TDS66160.1 hypothetical protein C8P70_10156 [Myroides indicus]